MNKQRERNGFKMKKHNDMNELWRVRLVEYQVSTLCYSSSIVSSSHRNIIDCFFVSPSFLKTNPFYLLNPFSSNVIQTKDGMVAQDFWVQTLRFEIVEPVMQLAAAKSRYLPASTSRSATTTATSHGPLAPTTSAI